MNRRGFLAAVGTLAGVEVDPAALAGVTAAADTPGAPDLAGLVERLPATGALAADADVAVAATRLVDGATALSGPVADADAVGTVLAGRIATDVAVGVADPGAVVDRLTAEGYEWRQRRDGWLVLDRSAGRRARVAAVGEAAAVLAAGPRAGPVRTDVDAVTAAVDPSGDGTATSASRRQQILDRLGSGVRVAVDLDPGPSAAAGDRLDPAPVATGERYAVRGETTEVRRVALFADAATARDAGPTPLGARPGPNDRATDVRRRGRAVVRDATVPTGEAFPSG